MHNIEIISWRDLSGREGDCQQEKYRGRNSSEGFVVCPLIKRISSECRVTQSLICTCGILRNFSYLTLRYARVCACVCISIHYFFFFNNENPPSIPFRRPNQTHTRTRRRRQNQVANNARDLMCIHCKSASARACVQANLKRAYL